LSYCFGRNLLMKLSVIFELIALTFCPSFNLVVMRDYCDHTSQHRSDEGAGTGVVFDEGCERPRVIGSSSALVPYDEQSLVVADFHRSERRLTFGDVSLTIAQDWRHVGVAAVVWDAVSSVCFSSCRVFTRQWLRAEPLCIYCLLQLGLVV